MPRTIARLAAAALVLMPELGLAGATPASGPSFDCANARGRDEKLVCEKPDLAAMDRAVADAYANALKRVGRDKASTVRKAQLEWIRGRAACGQLRDGNVPTQDATLACVRFTYARRRSELADLGAPPPPPVESRRIKWSDAIGTVRLEIDISYPSLPGSPRGAKAFTAWSEMQARKFEARGRELAADPDVVANARDGGLPSAVDVSFIVPLATPGVISVVFHGWEHMTGGAHGVPFQLATAFDLDRGRPLGDGDLFMPGGKERAADLVLAKLRTYADETGGEWEDDPTHAARLASDLSNWTFRADAVEVTFPVNTIASYATGAIPVWLSYDDLRSVLRADAPLPSR